MIIPEHIKIEQDGTIINTKTKRILKGGLNSSGYYQILINGKKYLRSHVVASILPNPNNYSEVNHIDGDTTNDNPNNLEWVTHQENTLRRLPGGNLRKIKILISNLNKSDKETLKKRKFIC